MSRIDHMGSGYISQTVHRACLLTDTPQPPQRYIEKDEVAATNEE
jgi:hypothetical protein